MDREELLRTFENCVRNNEAYFNKFLTNLHNKIIVTKYQYVPRFEITYLQSIYDGKEVVELSQSDLGPFDCLNLIEELMEH